jgi:hypothetical protein
LDWLRAQAIAGDRQALAALRARAVAPRLPGNTVGGTARVGGAPASKACDNITKNGTVIYRFGSTAVRDDGDKLTVSRGATVEGLQGALRMALLRYGPLLRVAGTAAFREEVVQAAVGAKLAVRFDDVRLEVRRQTILRQASARSGDHSHATNFDYQTAAPGSRTRDGLTSGRIATAMRRGNGRQRSGP